MAPDRTLAAMVAATDTELVAMVAALAAPVIRVATPDITRWIDRGWQVIGPDGTGYVTMRHKGMD